MKCLAVLGLLVGVSLAGIIDNEFAQQKVTKLNEKITSDDGCTLVTIDLYGGAQITTITVQGEEISLKYESLDTSKTPFVAKNAKLNVPSLQANGKASVPQEITEPFYNKPIENDLGFSLTVTGVTLTADSVSFTADLVKGKITLTDFSGLTVSVDSIEGSLTGGNEVDYFNQQIESGDLASVISQNFASTIEGDKERYVPLGNSILNSVFNAINTGLLGL